MDRFLKRRLVCILFFFLFFIVVGKAQLQIDSTFGINGWQKIKLDIYNDPIDVIADSEDTLYVLSNTGFVDSNLFNTDITITKLKPDGEPDTGFGENGTLRFDVNGFDVSVGKELLLLTDSELFVLASGYHSQFPGYSPFVIVKINTAGFIDSSFSQNGTCTIEFMKSHELPTSIEKDIQGNILVCGSTKDTIDLLNELPVIARINSKGILDSTFGENGKTYIQYAYGAIQKTGKLMHLVGGFIKDLVVLPNGKILAGGGYADGMKIKSFIVCIDPYGKIDSSFNDYGYVSFNITQYANNTVNKMVLYNDTLFFSMEASSDLYGDFFLGKLNIYTAQSEIGINEVSSQEDKVKDIILSANHTIIGAGLTKKTIHTTAGYSSDYFAISEIENWKNGLLYADNLLLQFDSTAQNGSVALIQQKKGRIICLGFAGTSLNGFETYLVALNDNNTLSVDDFKKPENGFTISPNPTTGTIRLQNLNENTSISIYNSVGILIKRYTNFKVNDYIDLSFFPKGVYFVKSDECSKLLLLE